MSAYLFVHFTMDGNEDKESIWFSLSRDGLHWRDIGPDAPVLQSRIGTKGIRDPFVVFDGKLRKYFIIATDLLTANGYDWADAATKGSRSILIWESEDLIHWSDERLVEVGVPGAGCVWAPEAVFCEEKNTWLVFWASCVKEPGDDAGKQRIYASFTSDFVSFSPAFKYIESTNDIIDTDIVRCGDWYYRLSKDETYKTITIERCRSLIPGESDKYENIHCAFLANYDGIEGPLAYHIEELNKWCLLVDRYRVKGGYLPLLTDEISSGAFEPLPPSAYDMGKRKKRHGGVLAIPDDLAERLIKHYGISDHSQ